MKKILIILAFVFSALIVMGFASAETTGCCEKTSATLQSPGGMPCQEVVKGQCNLSAGFFVPTACSSTDYCRPGTCFNVKQGTCLSNTPQKNCNPNAGIWKATPGPECELGCCILGDQAAFVTLTRCKWLSGQKLKIDTVFKRDIKNELTCISSVLGQEKGACVYEFEFTKNCKITTRSECAGGVSGTSAKGEFFKGKLCTAANISAISVCGETEDKMCVPGKEEVYSVDSCGNPSNVYDDTSTRPDNYWEDILNESEKCNPGENNAGSNSCGNCNYLAGSICRTDSNGENAKCADLNCKTPTLGGKYTKAELGLNPSGAVNERLHGESWCVTPEGNNAVGSRSYKKICINGEVILEQCDDFRQQLCINQSRNYTLSGSSTIKYYTQAACVVNRWQTCTAQTNVDDCSNDAIRDCQWIGEKCWPLNAPGLKFWEGEDAQAVCGQASTVCLAKAERATLLGEDWHLHSGQACADVSDGGKITIKPSWIALMNRNCNMVGDCGVKKNWFDQPGKLKLDSAGMFTINSVKS